LKEEETSRSDREYLGERRKNGTNRKSTRNVRTGREGSSKVERTSAKEEGQDSKSRVQSRADSSSK